ncbi:MAG TPA: RNA-directed DNA polymerase [Flavobacteriales bacterium]|nr:RNA-directed DNA polymerase [Flavobacteriales bacterium]
MKHGLHRPGGLRRELAIPNPRHFIPICEALEKGWQPTIEPLLSQIKLGISRPVPSAGVRSIKSKGEPTRDLNKAMSRSGARYVLKADVQRFYPSIYTHSIPWALHGKSVAKANRSPSLVGNAIDKAVRDAQDGQTIGVPIGPDTSAIIAECLMAAVERDLIAQVGKLNGWRYTDDIELAFSTVGEAERGLSALMEVLAGYEMSLSPAKTAILELPEALGKRAIRDFRDFAFRDTEAKQRQDLLSYFDLLFDAIQLDRTGHYAAYAISRLREVKVYTGNWSLVQASIMQLLIVEPSCALQVAAFMDCQCALGHVVEHSALTETTERLASRHAPLGHGSELAWALWLCIAHGAKVSQATANAVSKMSDNVVALLALDAKQRGLVDGTLDVGLWESFLSTDELDGPNWLLSYEAEIKGWLSGSGTTSHIDAHPFFNALKTNNVQFYTPALGVVGAAAGSQDLALTTSGVSRPI